MLTVSNGQTQARISNMKKFIITILILLGVAISFNSPVICQATRTITKTIDLPLDGMVSIDTYKGSITVITWDNPKVEIIAEIEADGEGDYEEEKVYDTEIKIRERKNEVAIITDYDRVHDHHSWFFDWFGVNSGSMPFVHYRISMPVTASLKIKDYKSDTKITDLKSSLTMETYKGSVIVQRFEGAIDLETYKGDVEVHIAQLADDSKFETYKGDIEIFIPEKNSVTIDAVLGRRVEFDSDFDIQFKRQSRHDKRILNDLNGGGKVIKLRSEKGNIRLLKQR
ncbi:MAG: hypothetical protein C0417_07510 [Chlorobiaceae bacterium]|nr:hypothetical protein [Chlorobiaceae bacterium]